MHARRSSIYIAVTFLSATTAVLGEVQPWGQCGGQGYQGDTTCADGWTCTELNPYYSQCLGGQNPGGNQPAPTSAPSQPTDFPGLPGGGNGTSIIVSPTGAPELPGNGTQPTDLPSTFETVVTPPSPTAEPDACEVDLEPNTDDTSCEVDQDEDTVALTSDVPVPAPTSGQNATSPAAAPTSVPSSRPIAGNGKNGAKCSLDAAIKAAGKKYIGVATDQRLLEGGQNADIIKANFGQVTPENRSVMLS